MSRVGLSGRSFLPLLTGYACAIPAFLAARNIPKTRERKLVQWVLPLMSCSARLPVYGLLISLLIPAYPEWVKATAMTGVYFVSTFLSLGICALLSRFSSFKSTDESSFYMHMPKWKKPAFGSILQSSFQQGVDFLRKVGPHILWISVVLWALTHYPSSEASYAHKFGQLLEPIFLPMGIDWRVGVALIFAFAAREVFVPALTLAFALSSDLSLISSLRLATIEGSEQMIFTPSTVIGLIFYFMISLQCLSTVAVARKELKSRGAAIGMLAGYTFAGYLIAVILVQGLRVLGLP